MAFEINLLMLKISYNKTELTLFYNNLPELDLLKSVDVDLG